MTTGPSPPVKCGSAHHLSHESRHEEGETAENEAWSSNWAETHHASIRCGPVHIPVGNIERARVMKYWQAHNFTDASALGHRAEFGRTLHSSPVYVTFDLAFDWWRLQYVD
eukprot:746126-Prorocentrum_minimum.AAC.1